MTTDLIHAPWTAAQVTALNAFQHHGRMHPFTCGAEHASGQSPVLVATNGGWVCPDPQCVYRQDWAHAFMAEPAGLAVGLGVSATPSHTDELAALAVNAGRALQDEKRHYEIACRENAELRATIARVRRLHDVLEEETALTSPDAEITRGAAARKIAAALDGWTDPAELRRLADEAQQQEPESGCAHCGGDHSWDDCQAYTAVVADEPQSEPSVHGESVAHLAGLHDGRDAWADDEQRQGATCTNCRGSGLDPRCNGEFDCPDCTTAVDARQDGEA